MDAHHFGPAAVIRDDGLAASMDAEIGPKASRQIFYRCDTCQTHPEVIIHGEIKIRVERSNLLPQIMAEECRLLRYMYVALSQTTIVGLSGRKTPNDLPMLSIAGLGVAFNAKPLVRQKAANNISSVGLDGLLYLIGLHEREIKSEVRQSVGYSYG